MGGEAVMGTVISLVRVVLDFLTGGDPTCPPGSARVVWDVARGLSGIRDLLVTVVAALWGG